MAKNPRTISMLEERERKKREKEHEEELKRALLKMNISEDTYKFDGNFTQNKNNKTVAYESISGNTKLYLPENKTEFKAPTQRTENISKINHNTTRKDVVKTKGLTYAAVNDPKDLSEQLENPVAAFRLSHASAKDNFPFYAKYMSDREISIYNDLYDRGKTEEADRFAHSLVNVLQIRHNKAGKNENDEYYKNLHNKKLQLETVVANDDFERLSKVQDHDNIIWDAVNRTERAGTKIINNKDSNNSQPLPLEKYYYYMTDIERAVYNYYYNKHGETVADNYINTLDRELDSRVAQAEALKTADYTEEHPIAAGVSYPFRGLAAATGGNIETIGQNVSNASTGQDTPINIYSPNFKQVRERETISEGLTKDKGVVASLLIQTGLSMGDMAVALPFGAAAAPVILSSNAAAEAAYDATKRGASAGQALASGIASGAAEYFAERLPIENLFKIAKMPKSQAAKYIIEICKQAHLEGSEEFVTQIVNNISDSIIMGEKSNYNMRVLQYVGKGMTKASAEKLAFIDMYIKESAMAYAGGAISGGLFGTMGAGKSAVSNVNNTKKVPPSTEMPKSDVQGSVSADVNAEPASTEQSKGKARVTPHLTEYEQVRRAALAEKTGKAIDTPVLTEHRKLTYIQRKLINDAKKAGLDVTFFKSTSKDYDVADIGVNGSYLNGHIYINVNAENPYSVVLGHEVVHQMKEVDVESYNKLVDIVRNELGADSDFDTLTADKQEEAVADIMGDIIADPQKYKRVFAQDVSFGQRVLDYINGLIERFKASTANENGYVSEYTRKLLTTRNKLTKIMADSVVNMQNKTDVQHSGEVRDSLYKGFKKDVDKWNTDGRKTGGYFYIGNTSEALKSIDAPDGKIYWDKSKIINILNDHPEMDIDVIKEVPEILENPILVMQSQTRLNRIVMFGNVYAKNNKPVMAVLELRPTNEGMEIADYIKVANSYTRSGDLQSFINNSNILYIEPNKNKTDSWLEALRLQLPAGLINYGPISKITYYDDVVKSDNEKTAMQYAYEQALAKKQLQNTPNTQYMQNDENDAKNSTMRGKGAVHGRDVEQDLQKNQVQHIYNDKKVSLGFINAVDNRMLEFIDESTRNSDDNKSIHVIGNPTNKFVERVKELTGIDTELFRHYIKANSIRHIIKEHGINGTTDQSMADIKDISRMGYILNEFDNIELLNSHSKEYRDKNQQPAPMIKISKKVDGTYYVVEAVPDTKYKGFAVVSAYIEKASKQQTENVQAFSSNVQNASADNEATDNIPQLDDSVNREQTKSFDIDEDTKVNDKLRKIRTAFVNDVSKTINNTKKDFKTSLRNLFNSMWQNYKMTGRYSDEVFEELDKLYVDVLQTEGVDHKQFKANFFSHIESMEESFAIMKKYLNQQKKEKKQRIDPSKLDFETLKKLYNEYYWAHIKVIENERDIMLSEAEEDKVKDLLRGKIVFEDIPDTYNKGEILKMYNLKKPEYDLEEILQPYQDMVADKYIKDAEELTETIGDWRTMRQPVNVSLLMTPKRQLEYMIPNDPALRDKIYNKIYKPVSEAVRQRTIFVNQNRQKIADLKLSHEESIAVQMVAEPILAKKMMESPDIKERWAKKLNTNSQKLKKVYEKYKNGGFYEAKLKRAVETFRSIYDESINLANDTLIKCGQMPIGVTENYMPHFWEYASDNKFFGWMLDIMQVSTVEAELSGGVIGKTHMYKPSRSGSVHEKSRLGEKTMFDAVKGFERYIEPIADIIFLTEPVQQLRAMESVVRMKYTDKSYQNKLRKVARSYMRGEGADWKDFVSLEHKRSEAVRASEMNWFIRYLSNYTNGLIGKGQEIDRGLEDFVTREVQSIFNRLTNNNTASLLVGNIRTATTNLVSIFQAIGTTKKPYAMMALYDTIHGFPLDASKQSRFLITRNPSKPLDRSGLQKTADILNFQEYTDWFAVNVIWRMKYYENLVEFKMFPDEAIDNADEYCKWIVAGRAKGDQAPIFNIKNPVIRAYLSFQTEPVNQQFLYPEEIKYMKDRYGWRGVASHLIWKTVLMFLVNEALEKVMGRKVMNEPAGLVIDFVAALRGYQMPNFYDMLTGEKPYNIGRGKALLNVGSDFIEGLPIVGGLVGGGYMPVADFVPNLANAFKTLADENMSPKDKGMKIGKELGLGTAKLLWPHGLIGQVEKTIKGLKILKDGGDYTQNGNLKYPVENSSINQIKGALYGPKAFDENRHYYEQGLSSFSDSENEEYLRRVANKEVPIAVYGDITNRRKIEETVKMSNMFYRVMNEGKVYSLIPEKDKAVYNQVIELQKQLDDNGIDGNVMFKVPDASYEVDGEKYMLRAKEYEKYIDSCSKKAMQGLRDLTDTIGYKNADTKTKVKLIQSVYEYSRAKAKAEFSDKFKNSKNYKDNYAKTAFAEEKKIAAGKYLAFKSSLPEKANEGDAYKLAIESGYDEDEAEILVNLTKYSAEQCRRIDKAGGFEYGYFTRRLYAEIKRRDIDCNTLYVPVAEKDFSYSNKKAGIKFEKELTDAQALKLQQAYVLYYTRGLKQIKKQSELMPMSVEYLYKAVKKCRDDARDASNEAFYYWLIRQ